MFTGLLIAAAGLGLHQRLPAETWLMDPPPRELLAAAAQLGLTPRALAASGVSAVQTAAMVDLLSGAEAELGAVAAAEQAVDAANGQLSSVLALAAASPHDAQLEAQLAQARVTAEAAQRALDAARAALMQEVAQAVPAGVLERLTSYRANAEAGLAPALRVVPWSDAEVRQLRRAAVAVRRAQRRGEQPPPEAAAMLAAARADSRVVEAEAWLTTRLAEIRAVLGQS